MRQGRLGDFVEFAYGKSLPARNRKPGPVPVYGSAGVVDLHNAPLVKAPGVIVGRKGTVGAVYWADQDFFPIDTTYYVIPKSNDIRMRYVYYLLKSLPLPQMNTDVAVPGLNRSNALRLKITMPSSVHQDRVVDILSAYDDLIENNRRRIQLLEQAARLLYKEWFVHLRFPGHEHVKIKACPGHRSGDGVPEGWEKKVLGDLCKEIRETVSPEKLEPNTPYIGLEHLPRRSISLNEWGTAEQVTSSKHRFRENEILFGKIRPYFHKVGIAFVDGVASSDAIIIRPLDDVLMPLVLMTVSSDRFVAVTAQAMKAPRCHGQTGSKCSSTLFRFLVMDYYEYSIVLSSQSSNNSRHLFLPIENLAQPATFSCRA